ncbi:virion transmembrane glycoprotein G [Coastal Plains virus]|uniref:Virion transmembrane glycoprotein G n=1 Tax=Coastal Plains virus TaxID=764599 RepID=D8V085_9RHAB|nr:virion transmembrane glycoprotein G [Coastal Plains virus]ADG86362.1 virion transmembrane glycoprotein G [Coastal Plains virus]
MSSRILSVINLIAMFISASLSQLIYNYPFNCKQEINLLPFDSIQCPMDYNTFNLKSRSSVEEGTMCRPNPLATDLEEGYMCYKDRWVTRCEENWYFSKTVTNHIVHEPVSKDECVEALALFKMGQTKDPFFPAPSCYWSAANEESVTFLMIKKHPVVIDPYSGKIKDPLIDNDLCKDGFCKTRAHQTHWMRDYKTDIVERCDDKTWECHPIKVYYGWVPKIKNGTSSVTTSYVETGLVIESQYLGHVLVTDLCQKTFCQQDGYLFPDGSWWQIKISLTKLLLKNHNALEKAKTCGDRDHGSELTDEQRSGKIGFEDLEINLENIEMKQKSQTLNLMCLEKVAKMRNSQSVNFLDISYLTPKKPGPGLAYYIVEEPLMSGQTKVKVSNCQYKFVEILGSDKSGIVNVTEIGSQQIFKLLETGQVFNMSELGIPICEDHTQDNETRNITCETDFGISANRGVKGLSGKPLWTVRSFKGSNISNLRGLRIGSNGITYDMTKKILRFPQAGNMHWDIPSYYSTEHKVHFFQHPTKHEIYKNFTGDKKSDIDFLEDLIHRKLNRTDFPTRIKNWIGNIEDKVEHFFTNLSGTVRTAISLVIFVIGTLLSIKVWRRCKKQKPKTRKIDRSNQAKEENSFALDLHQNVYEDIEPNMRGHNPFHRS